MTGKTIIKMETPKTQSVAAIQALLQWKGRASDPLPEFVELGKEDSRLVLVLSNKKDCYYVATARACSCPGNQFRHNCKHQRKHFPEAKVEQSKASEPLIQRGGFRPVDLLPSEERAAKASSLSAIDCHDTTPRDVAYHSIREDREMWSAEA